MDYSKKLKDPRWQRLRLEVMERDDFKCTRCGDAKRTLHVNHLKYTGDPWEAPMEHLETLCESCHKWRTALNSGFQLTKSSDMPKVAALSLREYGYGASVIDFIYEQMLSVDSERELKEDYGDPKGELQRSIDHRIGMLFRVVMGGLGEPMPNKIRPKK